MDCLGSAADCHGAAVYRRGFRHLRGVSADGGFRRGVRRPYGGGVGDENKIF